MYDENAAKRMVGRMGIDSTIEYLSGDLDAHTKDTLTKLHLLVGGHPNLTLIYSLA